jgi:hypothetical protein
MSKQEYEAAMAAFLAKKQITRCPTAYALPTHTVTSEEDREALRRHAEEREAARAAAARPS